VTIIVGVCCSDGVVIGADSLATSTMGPQPLFKKQSGDKIATVGDRVIVACTGAVGLSQRFCAVVQDGWNRKIFQHGVVKSTTELAKIAVSDFQASGVPRHQQFGYNFGALVAAPIDGAAQLIEFATVDLQPETKSDSSYFVAMGSGQMLAEPFLAFVDRVLWKNQMPDVRKAMFGVYWALNHTITYAPMGVGAPIKVAVLRKDGKDWSVQKFEEADIQETIEHIAAIEQQIGASLEKTIEAAAATEPPKPP
jgi:20S proteasome alpha/beta subunit